MRVLIAALLLGTCLLSSARAQETRVVASCGTAPLAFNLGSPGAITVNQNGQLCISAISLPTNQTVNVAQIGGVAAVIGATPTDRTITSASGASQTLASANMTRHSLTVVNTGNANCGVNPTGGTAAIGGVGTLTLAPLGAYTPRIPTLGAVTVICTAGQPVYADEN